MKSHVPQWYIFYILKQSKNPFSTFSEKLRILILNSASCTKHLVRRRLCSFLQLNYFCFFFISEKMKNGLFTLVQCTHIHLLLETNKAFIFCWVFLSVFFLIILFFSTFYVAHKIVFFMNIIKIVKPFLYT